MSLLSYSEFCVLLYVKSQVYRDVTSSPSLYLTHRLTNTVRNVKFCPYEDVLGVGHASGFSSLLVPGYSVLLCDVLCVTIRAAPNSEFYYLAEYRIVSLTIRPNTNRIFGTLLVTILSTLDATCVRLNLFPRVTAYLMYVHHLSNVTFNFVLF